MEKSKQGAPSPLVIPLDRLSTEALMGLIDEFILREGTDYGLQEYTLDQKRSQVLKQLESGRVAVVFDPAEETCSILNSDQLPRT